MRNQWVVRPRPVHNAKIKLLCFPYAGSGIPVYVPWKNKLPDNVELNIIQLPGRGTHFSQSPIDNMNALIESLLPALSDLLEQNYVIYGHSLGSRIGFELVRQAMIKGFPAPRHFFASGSASPDTKFVDNKMYELADDAFIQMLKDINGTPREILDNRQFIGLLLPAIRADFKLSENYVCHNKFTIPTDVTILSGSDERISTQQLQKWGGFLLKSKTVIFMTTFMMIMLWS